MAQNNNNHNIRKSTGLSQDAQGRWWELLSPSQVLTEEEQRVLKKKRKCHGNRKLQHFKRKCRARGLNIEAITVLIHAKNRTLSTQLPNDQMVIDEIKKLNKRKRDLSKQDFIDCSVQPMSQLSISQEAPKKKKNSTQETMLSIDMNSNHSSKETCTLYKPSKYLKMPRNLLLQSLRLQLKSILKKKTEQRFILTRLQIVDQQFCLDQIRYLYQTYFDLGFQHQTWPDDILKIIQSNEYNVIQTYLEEYVIVLRNKIQQHTTELTTQSSASFPSTLYPLEMIDLKLKDFVRLHHIDLIRQINYQVNKLKDNIREKQFFQQLSSYQLTNEQQQGINRLITLRQKQLEKFEEMTMFEVRIVCKSLPRSINTLDKIIPPDDSPITSMPMENQHNNNNNLQQEVNKKHRKKIRDYKRQLLAKTLEEYESNIEQNEYLYQEELLTFEYELSQQTDQVKKLMQSLNSYLDCRTNKIIRKIRFKEAMFRMKLLHPRHHPSTTSANKTISIYPEAIVETLENPFSDAELTFLSSAGGPNYIRSNQSFLYHKKKSQQKTQLELSIIIEKLTSILHHRYGLPPTSLNIKQLSNHLETIFNERYTTSLSYLNTYRVRKEIKLVHSIRRKIKKAHYLIRVTDKSGIFHVGQTTDYDRKVLLYQEKTKAYVELSSNPLMDTFYKVVRLLNDLRSKQQIKEWQLKKMMPDQKKIKLAYLYFIPKPHKEGTPLRPIVSGINAPTIGISKMLDKLIRPLFDEYVAQTTIIDGVDLIRRLEKYVSLNLLKQTTHLCTFDITDLYTMLPQEESIGVLKKFLLQFDHSHVQGMKIDAIESLARIVLTENVFIYNNKYYRQIIGGAMGSPFTLTLANVFMWHWEQKLVENQKNSNELYGRYIDDIFLTSNDSIEKLKQMLEDANNLHSNIKLTYEVGNCVSFLDVEIKNQHGNLNTSVYHKEAAEPYVVPFSSDHPRHIFENIVRCALLRALRYSSTLKEFNHERRAIKLMLLYNGYPVRYIYRQFQKFFAKYCITSTSILPMIHDENEYDLLHQKLLAQPTPSEHARATRIASQMDCTKPNSFPDSLVQSKLFKRQQQVNSLAPLIIHYTHEQRFAHYKSAIHQKWNKSFLNTQVMDTLLVVGTRNNPNLTKELVRRSPYLPKRTKNYKVKNNANGTH